MDEKEDNLPRVQERIASIQIDSSKNTRKSRGDTDDTTATPVPTPSGISHSAAATGGKGGDVFSTEKRPVKRQLSQKYLRHISFSGDSPTRQSSSRGRTGSMAGDLSPGENVIRKTHVLLLYTGGALGWKLVPGGKR